MTDAPVVHVVDDDESARESLAFLLESADFDVVTYASAPAFLDALPDAKPGVVITDVRMPEMSGQDLVARLSALKIKMPIVMITGHGDIPMAVEAMRSGVVDFLEKPFSESRMLDALKRAFATVEAAPVSDDQQVILKRIESLSERERQVLELIA